MLDVAIQLSLPAVNWNPQPPVHPKLGLESLETAEALVNLPDILEERKKLSPRACDRGIPGPKLEEKSYQKPSQRDNVRALSET